MNSAYLHLVFVHLPIVGLLISIMINVYAFFKKGTEFKKFSIEIYMGLSILVLLAHLTGDGASDLLRTTPNFNADRVEVHEHFAHFMLVGILVLSALSGFSIIKCKNDLSKLKKMNVILFIVAILLSVIVFETAKSGALIQHPEIIIQSTK